jgi:hypothetical protein
MENDGLNRKSTINTKKLKGKSKKDNMVEYELLGEDDPIQ